MGNSNEDTEVFYIKICKNMETKKTLIKRGILNSVHGLKDSIL